MDIIADFNFILDKEQVLKCVDCYSDSKVYEEVCETYEILAKDIKEILEPKAIFKFGKRTKEYPMDDVKNCSHIVYCLLTLGKKVTEEAEKYFNSEQYIEGMLIDAMADVLLGEYSNQLYKKICIEAEKRGLGLTCKLSPGNADFPLSMQNDILHKLQGMELLNVDVTEGFMLRPVKSVSFIFGADEKLDIPLSDHECSRCTSLNCKMRKELYIDKKSSSTVNVTIISDEIKINMKSPKSKNILEFLIENGIKIPSPCAGNGTCGKCRIRILDGKVNKLQNNSILGGELLKEGWCLACSTFFEEDCIISINTNINKKDEGFSIVEAFDNSNTKVKSAYKVIDVHIEKENLNGSSITEMINSKLSSRHTFTIKALKKLGTVINYCDNSQDNTSLYGEENVNLIVCDNTVLDVCKINDNHIYGIAIDIGTTTIALSLINLITGENVKSYSLLNSQKQFGADVISRIQYSNQGKLEQLNKCIKKDLIKGIKDICSSTNIKSDQIYHVAIAGNTTMLYFLIGLPSESLALFPFNTITTSILEYNFNEIFEDNLLDCAVTLLPGVSAYVGADIVSGMLKCEFNKLEKTCLLIDIGTNGEMAIGNKDKILCLATAAGPAFEGANITCGTGSIKGAISSVNIKDGKILYKTIGNEMPEGICGSAVIDITAACINNSIIDETGRFDEYEYEESYIKVAKNKNGEDIIFNQKDVREVQLAKSAIRSGIEILLKEFNSSYEDIDTVFLAGGFGYHMNVENAAFIGLIPEELKSKVKCIGNSSLGGAVSYLLNEDSKKNLIFLLDRTSYIDISSNSSFNELFVNNMLF